MEAARIQARAVVKVAAISLAVIAVAILLMFIVVHVQTTIRWLFTALFLWLALNPAVDRIEAIRIRGRRPFPRWLAILLVYVLGLAIFVFLVLQVVPPIIDEFENLGSKVPGYVQDFTNWANQNSQFQDLNSKYHITSTLQSQASSIPSKLGAAAGDVGSLTVSILEHLVALVVVLALTFFLLLDGRRQGDRLVSMLDADIAERLRRIGTRIAGIVKSYVSVNLLLAIAAGLFTWASLEILGVDLAVTMGVIVGFLDLMPLIGFTIGGLFVAVVAAFHDFPTALIIWAILFVVYQQVQDRVIQPLLYHSAVRIHPAIAIVAILMGAELAGVLGALLAIPVAAAIGVLIDEGMRWRRETSGEAEPPADQAGPAPQMIDSQSACARGSARPSSSRTQGAAFGAKGKPEDAEMRRAGRIIRVRGDWGSVISARAGGGLTRRGLVLAPPPRWSTVAMEPSVGARLLLLAVEDATPERLRMAEPERRHDPDRRDQEPDDGNPELLLRQVHDRGRDADEPGRADECDDDVLHLRGDVHPGGEPHQDHSGDGGRDDHGVDRLAALLRPVDVLQVEPEGELVQREPHADAEEHGDDLVPGGWWCDRDTDVAGDHQEHDSPDEVMDVGPPHLHVSRPPADLGLDHVSAGADEGERDQERDEEQELGLAPGVDDCALVQARDTGEGRAEHAWSLTAARAPTGRARPCPRCGAPR
jgi:predicted PurR-regulated permease PerM